MDEEIRIEIDTETGKMKIKTEGIKGEACVEEVKTLIDNLAMAINWEHTDEYYQEEQARWTRSVEKKQNVGGKRQ